jgi:GTPase SAR1 family protein
MVFRMVSDEGSDYLFKLLLIGDSSVGKSCLLLRFAVSKSAPILGLSSDH